MFYNDFILVFIEKYQQKYQQKILLPTKKPIFVHFTASRLHQVLPQGYHKVFMILLESLR